jgi:hypothetical protein
MPRFELLDCGKDDLKMWRHYTLTIPEGMHMIITEVFPAALLELDFEGDDKFTREVWETVPGIN